MNEYRQWLKEKGYCINCGKELPKSAKKFCSPKCQNDYYYKQYISKWKKGEENGLSGEY